MSFGKQKKCNNCKANWLFYGASSVYAWSYLRATYASFKNGSVFCCLTTQASGLATVNEAEKVIVP